MSEAPGDAPEFSRSVPLARLGAARVTWRIAATAGERAALARRFVLVALDRLEAEIGLRREPDGSVRLDGTLDAAVTQACVVTLDSVASTVADRFVLLLRPGLDDDAADRLALEDPDGDLILPLPGESIDIGEVVAQHLSIAIDPYPKAPEALAATMGQPCADTAAPGSESPFAALAALKRRS